MSHRYLGCLSLSWEWDLRDAAEMSNSNEVISLHHFCGQLVLYSLYSGKLSPSWNRCFGGLFPDQFWRDLYFSVDNRAFYKATDRSLLVLIMEVFDAENRILRQAY